MILLHLSQGREQHLRWGQELRVCGLAALENAVKEQDDWYWDLLPFPLLEPL